MNVLSRLSKKGGHLAGLVSATALLLASDVKGQEPMPQPAPPRYIDAFFKPPDHSRVFRLESYNTLEERMAREALKGINPLDMEYKYEKLDYPPPTPTKPIVRQWEPMTAITEPAYVCHNRLFFQQLNAERYGWSFGVLHPLISTGRFYIDMVTLPYHAAQRRHDRYECSAGYALPGDQVPLMIYTPKPSLSGALTQAAVIGLLFVAFP